MNSKNHTGAYSELSAASYFLARGYEVFRNVAASGPVDIVIMRDGKYTPIDIKSTNSAYVRADGTKCYNIKMELRLDGVWQIGFDVSTGEFLFPEGFWEAV